MGLVSVKAGLTVSLGVARHLKTHDLLQRGPPGPPGIVCQNDGQLVDGQCQCTSAWTGPTCTIRKLCERNDAVK